jgi:hypothetical protein
MQKNSVCQNAVISLVACSHHSRINLREICSISPPSPLEKEEVFISPELDFHSITFQFHLKSITRKGTDLAYSLTSPPC